MFTLSGFAVDFPLEFVFFKIHLKYSSSKVDEISTCLVHALKIFHAAVDLQVLTPQHVSLSQ